MPNVTSTKKHLSAPLPDIQMDSVLGSTGAHTAAVEALYA